MSAKKQSERTIGNFKLGKTIGEGTFGKVKIGLHITTNEKVAIKILEKKKITDKCDMERLAREINILKILRHPNIIQLYQIIETKKEIYLIMEYASGGELFDYIIKHQRVKEMQACRFFQQILAGVEYLHKLNVAHRDLKPENLLLDHNKNIKIVDFGLSNIYGTDNNGNTLKTACGSPCYAAPEMIAGKRYKGLSVDIWSCGIILYAMLYGYLPFEDNNTSKLYKKILAGEYETHKSISKEANALLKSILTVDPEKRFKLHQIKKHPWYNMVVPENSEGIISGFNQIMVKESLLKEMKLLGYEEDVVRKNVQGNKHNDITTLYYLLSQKAEKNTPTQERVLVNTLSASTEINLSQINNTINTTDFTENFNATSSSLPYRNDSKTQTQNRTNTVQVSLIDLENHPSILLTTDPNLENSRTENIPLMQSMELHPLMQSVELMKEMNANSLDNLIGSKSVTISARNNSPRNLLTSVEFIDLENSIALSDERNSSIIKTTNDENSIKINDKSNKINDTYEKTREKQPNPQKNEISISKVYINRELYNTTSQVLKGQDHFNPAEIETFQFSAKKENPQEAYKCEIIYFEAKGIASAFSFHFNNVFAGDFFEIRNRLKKALKDSKLLLIQCCENKFACSRENLKFEVELKNFPNNSFQNLHILKSNRINGDAQLYNALIKELNGTLSKFMKTY